MLSYLIQERIKCAAQCHIIARPASPVGLFCQLRACLLDTSQDGCHLEVFSVGSGCHVANSSYLVPLELDTALINVVRRDEVVRWSGLPP